MFIRFTKTAYKRAQKPQGISKEQDCIPQDEGVTRFITACNKLKVYEDQSYPFSQGYLPISRSIYDVPTRRFAHVSMGSILVTLIEAGNWPHYPDDHQGADRSLYSAQQCLCQYMSPINNYKMGSPSLHSSRPSSSLEAFLIKWTASLAEKKKKPGWIVLSPLLFCLQNRLITKLSRSLPARTVFYKDYSSFLPSLKMYIY